MKKICIFNIKGGVGKTTTSVNLAAGLARKGKKVLLFDMDAQGSISSCISAEESIKDMYHLIANGAQLKECVTHAGENLDIVTSKETLNDVDAELADRANREFILSNKLEKLKGYDYIIMDCPPHFGTMTKNALFFADEIHIPVSTDVLGYSGLKKTIQLIDEINEHLRDDKLTVTKIVPTLYDRRLKLSKRILSRLQDEFYEIMAEPIRHNSKIKEAPQKKRSIFSYARTSTGAKDYGKYVDEIIRIEQTNEPKATEFLEMEREVSEMMSK